MMSDRTQTGQVRAQAIIQIGIVVRSLSTSVSSYKQLLGIEDWQYLTVDSGSDTNAEFVLDGNPEPVRVDTAWAQIGQMEIELIQPCDSLSPYAEFLNTHGPGVHHVLVKTGDWDADVSAMRESGVKTVITGRLQQSRFALLDTLDTLGFLCELADGPSLVPDAQQLPLDERA